MQHDVTAELKVYTPVTAISLKVMVILSSEDQDGLLGVFFLQLARYNVLVSAGCMKVCGQPV